MKLEDEIFQRFKIKKKTLIPYGFVKNEIGYQYSKVFMDTFRADIMIDEQGQVTGKIYDLDIDEEYIAFRIEQQIGTFISHVRESYQSILMDIRDHCFEKCYFVSHQANRITEKISNLYHREPEFMWEKFPQCGVFKGTGDQKWFAVIMNIDYRKIDVKKTGEVEIINVKLEKDQVTDLLKREGFYPSYHMNKKNWITMILNDTLSDEEILSYIQMSYQYTQSSKEWIVPANPQYYDIIHCFDDQDIIEWKQSSHINIGDKIYLYVCAPYSAILYQCEAVEVNIPYLYQDQNISMNHVMRIKLLKKYDPDQYTLSKLSEYGLKSIRGPRRLPPSLIDDLHHDTKGGHS